MKSLQSFSGNRLTLAVILTILSTTCIPTSTFASTDEGQWPTDQEINSTQIKSDSQPELRTTTQQQGYGAYNAATSLAPSPPTSTQINSPANEALNSNPNSNSNNKKVAAYMGLGIDILTESIIAQMPVGVTSGEGIIITRFASDSPGKKSGLLVHDILLEYDQTKIVHPQQFIDLVRKDQPGRVVQLKILRNGKILTHPVTLGMQQIPQKSTAVKSAGAPDTRNGLVIKQLGKNLYQANIRFTDANGNQQLRQYKGTREQIYYQAMNARDLPEADRQQILYAAGGPNKNRSNNNWGSFFPFGNQGNNGSFFPFGNNNNGNFGGFFPFSR